VRLPRIALNVLLFSIAALVVYVWMLKLSADLAWDEAWNFSAYASNPLKAVALYHEHNNHPLDSFLKSIFFAVLGFTELATLKITGFLYVVGYLAIAWIAFRRFEKDGWILGAALLVPMMLLTRGINHQAVELRGYFLSVVLQALYLLLLCRDTGLLRGGTPPPPPPWSRRTMLEYAALTALILWTLPSNILAMPPLWLLTAILFGPPAPAPSQRWTRRATTLVAAGGALTLILYAPIILTLALKISVFDKTPGRAVGDRLGAMRDEMGILISQLAPRGIPEQVFGWVLAAWFVLGVVLALRPGARFAKLGVLTMVVAALVRMLFAAVLFYPTRVRTALVPPLLFGMLLIACELTSRWRASTQVIVALAFTGVVAFWSMPAIVQHTGHSHVSSEVAAFLQAYGRPESRNMLIAHDDLNHALLPTIRAFGPERIVDLGTHAETAARFRGVPLPKPPASWKQSLRELVLPAERFHPIDASKVEVLVLVDHDDRPEPASKSSDPVIASIKARLTRHGVFDRPPFHLHVFEKP
jgi:hypothetical protein